MQRALLEVWKERRERNIDREKDPRTPWERDFARIIHCAAFRRLQGKTQVLGLGDSDFYRTRLTHSMEVSQVSTAITTYLKKNASIACPRDIPSGLNIRQILPDSHLIGAIGLAHDLGHPAYGHGGEVALNYCMKNAGGFEGNGQTLRILSRLEKYVEGYGLNPTRRMLLGVLKYPVPYDKAYQSQGCSYQDTESPTIPWLIKHTDYKPPKCYLNTESDVVSWILQPLAASDKVTVMSSSAGEYYRSLDASIMEIADDICYSVHDLEDAISLGLIAKENFWAMIEQAGGTQTFLKEIDEQLRKQFPCCESITKTLENLFSDMPHIRKGSIGRLVHLCIIHCRLRYDSGFASPLFALNVYLEPHFAKLQKQLGKVVANLVIKTPNVQQLEFKGQRIVIELFKALEQDAPRFLPESTRRLYEQASSEAEGKRIICDYLASMTDEYAAKLYERMFCPHRGSVFDRL